MTAGHDWDVVVVGAGPAGSVAALAALQAYPGARVLLLDRSGFPRDKSCGDGIAPHVLDVLERVGAGDVAADLRRDHPPVRTLELALGGLSVARDMRRPTLVVPRTVLDARLVEAAVAAGAELRRHRVREVAVVGGSGVPKRPIGGSGTAPDDGCGAGVPTRPIGGSSTAPDDGRGSGVPTRPIGGSSTAPDDGRGSGVPTRPIGGSGTGSGEGSGVVLDGEITARVLVAADGARSDVRRAVGLGPTGPVALGLRAYAPTRPSDRGRQVIRFGEVRQPSYAWAFDLGDGWANIGYGEVRTDRHPAPTRSLMRDRIEELLPGSTDGARDWLGHHLPLSGATWRHPRGPVLFAGDAAGLINPMTGEGIYYAVLTGALAGRAAAAALEALANARGTHDSDAGTAYRRSVRRLLRANLASTALAGRLASTPVVLRAGLRAAHDDARVFDDLVELGLGPGRITPRVLAGLLTHSR